MNLTLPFDTLLTENPDFNQSDMQAEIDALFLRQQTIDRFAKGEISADDLLEVLADQLIDIDQYVAEVEANVDLIICNG